MISRYFELKQFIDTTDGDLVLLLPSAGEDFETSRLFDSLKKFEVVSLTLQTESGIDLSDARALFDDLFVSYLELSYYLDLDHSSISKYQNFEKAMCLANSGLPFTTEHENVLQGMLPLDIEEITPGVKDVGYSKKILSAKRNQLKETVSCLSWVPRPRMWQSDFF